MKPISQFFYVSTAMQRDDSNAVQHILQISRRNNRRLDITGCLLFSGSCFGQVLEGRTDDVVPLVRRIAADSRHAQVRVLWQRDRSQREYGDWSMGYLHDLDLEDRLKALIDAPQPDPGAVAEIVARMRPDTVLGALR